MSARGAIKSTVAADDMLAADGGGKAIARGYGEVLRILRLGVVALAIVQNGSGKGMLTFLLQGECSQQQRILGGTPERGKNIGDLGLAGLGQCAGFVHGNDVGFSGSLQRSGGFEQNAVAGTLAVAPP